MIGFFQKRRDNNSMYLIKNGRIHVGDGTVLDGCDILTEGRVIRDIAPGICCQEAEVIAVQISGQSGENRSADSAAECEICH